MTRLKGKIALVTGAASGIGRAITERFLEEDAMVVAGDIDAEGLARLSHLASDQHLVTANCDVTNEIDVENLVSLATKHFGGLDVVVANAGAGTYGLLAEHPLEEWKRIVVDS